MKKLTQEEKNIVLNILSRDIQSCYSVFSCRNKSVMDFAEKLKIIVKKLEV